MSGLRLAAVGHRFGPTQVLAGIDLDLAPERVLALVGPSGCGKTTLLRLVAGLLTPAEGRIDNGFRCVVPVFHQPRLLPWQSALANIAFGLKARGVGRARRLETAAALGAQLGLTADDLAKFPHALSGGMQSRVALARAFALDPDLLLLDEPFSALDIGLKHELYGLLLAQVAQRQAAVLLITHDLMEAVRLSDRVLVMGAQPGRILRAFDPQAPRAARDDAWLYRTTADLMQAREVRFGFGLAATRPTVTALRTGR
jgi:NitT/TauT family transport system ATP-binding protein